MDRVEDKNAKFGRTWPVIKGLTYDMMKERERSEISQGHFGLGIIRGRNNHISGENKDKVSYKLNW